MTTLSVYPATLPSPAQATTTGADRRALQQAGPFEARPLQRDRLATQNLLWQALTPAEALAWHDWWKAANFGGNWFAASWPAPGGASNVRRFVGAPAWTYLPGGCWSVSVTAELRGAGLQPTQRLIDCALLLHFGVNAAAWEDFSLNDRLLTLHPNDGKIFGQLSGGLFGAGGRFQQAFPGDAASSHYASHSWLEVAGSIDFGEADFFIEFSSQQLTAVTNAQQVFDMLGVTDGGWQIVYDPHAGDPTNVELVFGCTENVSGTNNPRQTLIEDTEVDIGIRRRYAFSRHGQYLSSFKDGVMQLTSRVFQPQGLGLGYLLPSGRASFRIGCGRYTEVPLELIYGYDGVLDEMYVIHGPGSGVSANYTPTTSHY